MQLRRRAPFWSLFLVLLLGMAAGFYGSTALSLATGPQSKNPDFAIQASPLSQSVIKGSLATFSLVLSSQNNFAGSVNLNASFFPRIVNATSAVDPGSISLLTGSATSAVTVSTQSSTPVGTYALQVVGYSGRLFHNVTVFLRVSNVPSPDYAITSYPTTLALTAGSSGSYILNLTSLYGFSGSINLVATITPNGGNSPTLTLNPNSITLLANGSSGVILTARTTGFTPTQTYTIVVLAISGGVSHTVSMSLIVQ